MTVDFIFSSTTSHYIEDLEHLFSNVSRACFFCHPSHIFCDVPD